MSEKTQRVIDLVHRLDALRARREAIVLQLDAEITRTHKQLSDLLQDGSAGGSDGAVASAAPAAVVRGYELRPGGVVTQKLPASAPAPTPAPAPPSLTNVFLSYVANAAADSVSDRVVAAISEKPDIDYAELATRIYGMDTEQNRNRLRSAIHLLVKNRRLVRLGPGKWRAATIADKAPVSAQEGGG